MEGGWRRALITSAARYEVHSLSLFQACSGKIPLWFHIKEQSSREDILLTQMHLHSNIYQTQVKAFFCCRNVSRFLTWHNQFKIKHLDLHYQHIFIPVCLCLKHLSCLVFSGLCKVAGRFASRLQPLDRSSLFMFRKCEIDLELPSNASLFIISDAKTEAVLQLQP